MSEASVALNRFGYGWRLGDPALRNPKAGLIAQLRDFDPRPGPLASRPDTSGEAGALLQIIRNSRRAARKKQSENADQGASKSRMTREDRIAALPVEYRDKAREAYSRYRADSAARMRVAVTSPTPFAERLVHFWSNHFSVTARKPGTPFEVGNHEFNAIRPHVMGRFSDMLKAAVLHPAMLLYLDQFHSVGPNSTFGSRRRRRRNPNQRPLGINENLAREILELHTLGVDGGYSQADVTEFARALTGWTVPGLGRVGRFA